MQCGINTYASELALLSQQLGTSLFAAVRLEVKVWQLLEHPHIVCLYEVVETSYYIYLVMEYMEASCIGKLCHS